MAVAWISLVRVFSFCAIVLCYILLLLLVYEGCIGGGFHMKGIVFLVDYL